VLYCIILPLRPARVLPKYRRVWTDRGSPLLLHSKALRDALQVQLRSEHGEEVLVELGMLYSTPDVSQGLVALRAAGAQRIVVLPLFPQYTGTATAAAYDQVGVALRDWRFVPELHYVLDYAADAQYLEALAGSVRAFREQQGAGEHLLITFHGIPKQYVDDGDPYLRKCEATARALATRLGLADSAWSLSFQSRVGRAEWLRPYTDDVIKQLAQRGVKTVDAICPGFAVDCLETIDEIGYECDETFRHAGGGKLRYIPALNAGVAQVGLLAKLLRPFGSGR
jgi:ferrochelatase